MSTPIIGNQQIHFCTELIDTIQEVREELGIFLWDINRMRDSSRNRVGFHRSVINGMSLAEVLLEENSHAIFIGAMALPKENLPLHINSENELLKFIVRARLHRGV